jgi:hypothetical protein
MIFKDKKRMFRGFLFYGIGLIIGTIAVNQLWLKNREDLFSMWPSGRVKEKIIKGSWTEDSLFICYQKCYQFSVVEINESIKSGNVRFGISEGRRKPYPIYIIDSKLKGKDIRWHIESADSTSRIFKVENLPGELKEKNCECNLINN